LEDIAIVTGGRCIRQGLGEELAAVRPADLGSARQAWATSTEVCILGGRGDRDAIRERLGAVRTGLRTVPPHHQAPRQLEQRIGRLSGLAAVVRVGAASESARAELTLRLEAALNAGRAALREGVVAGGGGALLACAAAVEALPLDGDGAAGARALARALG